MTRPGPEDLLLLCPAWSLRPRGQCGSPRPKGWFPELQERQTQLRPWDLGAKHPTELILNHVLLPSGIPEAELPVSSSWILPPPASCSGSEGESGTTDCSVLPLLAGSGSPVPSPSCLPRPHLSPLPAAPSPLPLCFSLLLLLLSLFFSSFYFETRASGFALKYAFPGICLNQ